MDINNVIEWLYFMECVYLIGAVSLPLIRHMTVIVTDDHCPISIMNEKIPKLSTLWIVQSLICESPRPIDGHESYIAISDECE